MHCKLRPSDVAPVILGFHYEASKPNFSEIEQSAAELLRLKYVQFARRTSSWTWLEVDVHNSANSGDRYCTTVQFQHNRTMQGWVIDGLAKFFSAWFEGGGAILYLVFLEFGGASTCTKFGSTNPLSAFQCVLYITDNVVSSRNQRAILKTVVKFWTF